MGIQTSSKLHRSVKLVRYQGQVTNEAVTTLRGENLENFGMGLRITTWNVNGIRNPFGHQPWKDRKTFEGMFDALEADIVILQETKIQRQHLRDDMVLVPGWDCYWSLPMVKNGL